MLGYHGNHGDEREGGMLAKVKYYPLLCYHGNYGDEGDSGMLAKVRKYPRYHCLVTMATMVTMVIVAMRERVAYLPR